MKDTQRHHDPNPNPFDKLVDRATYAEMRGITYRTAEMEAHRGTGPKVTRIGRRAYYHLDDIEAWIEAQRAKGAARYEGKEAAR